MPKRQANPESEKSTRPKLSRRPLRNYNKFLSSCLGNNLHDSSLEEAAEINNNETSHSKPSSILNVETSVDSEDDKWLSLRKPDKRPTANVYDLCSSSSDSDVGVKRLSLYSSQNRYTYNQSYLQSKSQDAILELNKDKQFHGAALISKDDISASSPPLDLRKINVRKLMSPDTSTHYGISAKPAASSNSDCGANIGASPNNTREILAGKKELTEDAVLEEEDQQCINKEKNYYTNEKYQTSTHHKGEIDKSFESIEYEQGESFLEMPSQELSHVPNAPSRNVPNAPSRNVPNAPSRNKFFKSGSRLPEALQRSRLQRPGDKRRKSGYIGKKWQQNKTTNAQSNKEKPEDFAGKNEIKAEKWKSSQTVNLSYIQKRAGPSSVTKSYIERHHDNNEENLKDNIRCDDISVNSGKTVDLSHILRKEEPSKVALIGGGTSDSDRSFGNSQDEVNLLGNSNISNINCEENISNECDKVPPVPPRNKPCAASHQYDENLEHSIHRQTENKTVLGEKQRTEKSSLLHQVPPAPSRSHIKRQAPAPPMDNTYIANRKTIISASYHQGDSRFPEQCRGRQCVPNSLMSMIHNITTPVKEWATSDLNDILDEGNDMYLMLSRSSSIHHDYLNITELPHSLELGNVQYVFEFSEPLAGLLYDNNENSFCEGTYSLHGALDRAFKNHDSCFVIFGGNAVSVIRDTRSYYVFDPHSRSCSQGLISIRGNAVLVKVEVRNALYRHLINLAKSMELGAETQFEVTPCNIYKIDS